MRFFSVVLIVAVLAVLAAVGGARADGHSHRLDNQADEARNQAAESAVSASDLTAQISADSGRIDSLEGTIGSARAELADLQTELARSRTKLDRTRRELAKNASDRKFAGEQLTVVQGNLAERLVAAYTNEEPDALSILLGAATVDEALKSIELHDRLVAQDEALMRRVRTVRAQLESARRRLSELKRVQVTETERVGTAVAEHRETVTALIAQRGALLALRERRHAALASVKVDQRRWTAQATALSAEAAELSRLAAAQPAVTVTPTAPATGGQFIWPVNGPVVSPYGQRWGRLHSGIDISAPAGTPIAASGSGQVVFSGVMSGYGNLVVVQHAGGISTAYAHNSSNAVSVGQAVAQGQTIAYVGCTGHCFGDHVHFEVRVNGSPVDPGAYL